MTNSCEPGTVTRAASAGAISVGGVLRAAERWSQTAVGTLGALMPPASAGGVRAAALVCSVSLAAVGMTGQANAALLTGSSSPFAQVDAASSTDGIAIGGSGTITDVDVTIDFTKCDDPIAPDGTCVGSSFSFNSEIVFSLISPGGTTVNLVDANTYSGQTPGARVMVTFDDAAATLVGGTLASGTFRPVGSLASFNGQDAFGNWTLFFQDTVGADPLQVNAWSLAIQTDMDMVQVPEPGTLGLLGAGLFALGFTARRRRAGA